jgi:hypothetical protein
VQLIREAHLDRVLIGCSCILQPEGHGFVGLCPVRGDECCLDLVLLLERNLMIS